MIVHADEMTEMTGVTTNVMHVICEATENQVIESLETRSTTAMTEAGALEHAVAVEVPCVTAKESYGNPEIESPWIAETGIVISTGAEERKEGQRW